jgi:hypothetical protein
VLMGADHLCALAVVASPGASDVDAHRHYSSADARSDSGPKAAARARRAASLRRGARSFLLGVRWSVGHASGLAVVCAVFFASRRRFDLDRLSVVADKLVGASMIALGALSLFSLHRWRTRRAAERLHVADVHAHGPGARAIHEDVGVRVAARVGAESPRDEPFGATSSSESKTKSSPPSSAVAVRGVVLELEAGSDAHAAAHDLDVPHVHVPARGCDADVERAEDREGGKNATSSPGGVRTEDVAAVAEEASRARWSFGIGFVHGLAGPSGILAVLPAVVLEDAAKSTAYLVAFFVSSTASMAAFAGAFGAASHAAATRSAGGGGGGARNSDAPARVAMGLNLFAGCAAIVIGTVWVALSSLGMLGDL